MSRSGYSDDCDHLVLWRQAVEQATLGARGQRLLRRLRDALDAMPTKRLITDAIKDEAGNVCALGAIDPTAPHYEADDLAKHFDIARALAAEIVYVNDEGPWARVETPEERWQRMRAWVEKQIGPDDTPGAAAG
jgi:hypothetical protein